MKAVFVVVGGGIAGVSCAETLAILEPEAAIILISESSLIKTVTNLYAITRTLAHFDIEEKSSKTLTDKYKNVTVVHDTLLEIKSKELQVKTVSGKLIEYNFLCLCTGAVPKLIPSATQFPEHIIGIRDTDSVDNFIQKLSNSKAIIIVGNGGIASELVFKLEKSDVHWVVKDKHISATFVDPGAAEFFQPSLVAKDKSTSICKRMRYEEQDDQKSGAALGPDWYKDLLIQGSSNSSSVVVHYETEILSVKFLSGDTPYSLEVSLSSGEKLVCDLIVSATGVQPKSQLMIDSNLELATDGGINVNQFMETSVPNIYAAGDVCSANWDFAKHWFQMKLWTQARQMGCYAAKCMSGKYHNQEVLQDFCFEIFAHSTRLFGYKVILLGLYNGQGLGRNYEVLLRMTKGLEYVKFVLQDNKLQGALLIGDTDLEEMCENLILNQLDLSPYGDDILNPDIDIDDYFD